MRTELSGILKSAARRLVFRRVLESAAVTATCAAYCAAGAQLAIWLAERWPTVSAILCVAMAVSGVAVLAKPVIPRALSLDGPQSAFMGICCIASAGIAAAGWLGVNYADLHIHPVVAWALPAAWLAAGALLGAVWPLRRGVTQLQAAVHMDVQGGLAERLSTAIEVAGQDRHDARCAKAVCADAIGAIKGKPTGRLLTWRRTRSTVGALGLALAFCAALSFLPASGQSRKVVIASLSDLPDALELLTDQQVQSLTIRMRLLAKGDQLPAALIDAILKSADAAENSDAPAMREALGRLVQAGDDKTLRQIGAEVALALEGSDAASSSVDASPLADTSVPMTPETGDQPNGDESIGQPAAVYHPRYVALSHPDRPSPAADINGAPIQTMTFDAAWRAARNHAEAAIASGKVPQEYRQILRNFYTSE